MNYLSIDMLIRVCKGNEVIVEGNETQVSLKTHLTYDQIMTGIRKPKYKGYVLKALTPVKRDEFEIMVETIKRYGNTIYVESDIDVFLNRLKKVGLNCTAKWSKPEGSKKNAEGYVRGCWIIETIDRNKGI